ncbi:MAG TPA: response regulator transcription factor [Chitinophagales bacterium]|nr:response regulator transcription factor [Bacteroidota bacterium]MCB9075681.1 response regulator transcription factor [Chitinophagales bacterium]HMU98695.1 response regulator transcription factor [Chitinophagales bacterium]HMW95272.1 response regulator transcription factor [Chitinophagales bacterium]HMY43428.1 response regulator transcription factor [Chitinophagales bacterium]
MKNNIKILLVEDDVNLGFIVKDNLEEKGYTVTHCTNGLDAEREIYNQIFNIYVFDVMLPKKDGFTLATELREKGDTTPIIFLTAKEMQEDKIKGLSIGADDYMTKPFNFEELVLRIDAILRRTLQSDFTSKIHTIGQFEFDVDNLTLVINQETRNLTKKEAALLEQLILNVNLPVKRETLLNKIWKDNSYFAGRSMDVYITKLRKYLSDDPNVEIQNMHGVGFKLVIKSTTK